MTTPIDFRWHFDPALSPTAAASLRVKIPPVVRAWAEHEYKGELIRLEENPLAGQVTTSVIIHNERVWIGAMLFVNRSIQSRCLLAVCASKAYADKWLRATQAWVDEGQARFIQNG